MRPNQINITNPQQGETLAVAGGNYRILLSGAQTGNAFAAIEMWVPPQNGPGPHAHAGIQETFYVLEGEVVFKSETQEYTATQGATINIPTGGAVHCFKNESARVARLLCIVVPAGLDAFFKEVGKPVAFGEFLPKAAPSPEELQRMQALAVKYGQELFPPDYLDK